MDNTWATPLYFKPLEHGVDISIQAGTKYIAGHSDVMSGMITTTEECYSTMRRTAFGFGQCAGPDDTYAVLRGLRTLRRSANPVLRRKAERDARELRTAYPVFLAGRLLTGNAAGAPWVLATTSLVAVSSSVAMTLAFFPPAAYLRRLRADIPASGSD